MTVTRSAPRARSTAAAAGTPHSRSWPRDSTVRERYGTGRARGNPYRESERLCLSEDAKLGRTNGASVVVLSAGFMEVEDPRHEGVRGAVLLRRQPAIRDCANLVARSAARHWSGATDRCGRARSRSSGRPRGASRCNLDCASRVRRRPRGLRRVLCTRATAAVTRPPAGVGGEQIALGPSRRGSRNAAGPGLPRDPPSHHSTPCRRVGWRRRPRIRRSACA